MLEEKENYKINMLVEIWIKPKVKKLFLHLRKKKMK